MGRFEMCVCSARNIANLQTFGTPDPYVKISVCDGLEKKSHTYKTTVKENDLAPVWNEIFKFQVGDPDMVQIKLDLMNSNLIKDDVLGTYNLSINGLEKGVVKDAWLILQGTKKSTTELHVRLLGVDFGASPSPGATVITSMEQDNYLPKPKPNGPYTSNVTVYINPPGGSNPYPSGMHAPQMQYPAMPSPPHMMTPMPPQGRGGYPPPGGPGFPPPFNGYGRPPGGMQAAQGVPPGAY